MASYGDTYDSFLPDPFSRLFLSAHVTNAVPVIDQPMQMGTFICRGYFSNCQALPRVLLTGACWFVLACGLGLPLLGLASLLVIINPSHFDRRCTATSYGFHAMLGRGFLCCSVWVTRTRAWQWGLGLRFADERETRTAFHFSQHCPSFRARRERIVKIHSRKEEAGRRSDMQGPDPRR